MVTLEEKHLPIPTEVSFMTTNRELGSSRAGEAMGLSIYSFLSYSRTALSNWINFMKKFLETDKIPWQGVWVSKWKHKSFTNSGTI